MLDFCGNASNYFGKTYPQPSKWRMVSAFAALLGVTVPAAAQISLPPDAAQTCTVSAPLFNSWFTSGSVSLNGSVDPANGLTFPNIPNCSFYQWSEQMFLWLTSPVQARYGGGSHVFNSSIFFDVGTGGSLTPHSPGVLRDLRPTISQLGPKKTPVMFDKTGKMFDVVRPVVRPISIRAPVGTDAAPTIGAMKFDGARPVFMDKAGRTIADINRHARLVDQRGQQITLQLDKSVSINGRKFLLDARGRVVDFEFGQADGNALIAQNNTPVFYLLQVNDVMAYMRTGEETGGIVPKLSQFPVDATALNKIKAFALTKGKTLPDDIALTVELKSSWIETTGLADPSRYIVIDAKIPTYDTSNPSKWVQNGSKNAKIAMVGMHVVGTTVGHPEMIWATFEHIDAAPNSAYSYNKSAAAGGGTGNISQSLSGNWLLAANNFSGAANDPRAFASGSDIQALPNKTVGPSNILRINPWGMPGTSAASNTEIISINQSVISKLAAGDVRKNYVLTGATWTPFGVPANGNNSVGTSQLANTSMETFDQPSNCFSCHQNAGGQNLKNVSHIYGGLQPLP